MVIQTWIEPTRFPGKSLKEINDKPMLELIINNIVESGYMSKYVVATSRKSGDDEMYNFCQKLEIDRYRGSDQDVLSRFKKIK